MADKPRNDGTMTEAAYWGFIRSNLRRAFRYWKPIKKAKDKQRRPYKGENKRRKWEYKCEACHNWFKGDEVEVDHINPLGSLRCSEDLAIFIERLSAEDGYQLLCKPCHLEKTKMEREVAKERRRMEGTNGQGSKGQEPTKKV